MAAGIVVAALVLGNAVLVSRLMGEGSPVTRGAGAAGSNDASRSSFKELREALKRVQASISADVEALSITAGKDRAERSDKPRETSTVGSNTQTVSAGSSSGSNSTGSTSGGSSSTGSDSTDSGSGGSSGGDDSGSDDTGGGGPGGGGGSDGGGGDSGDGGGSGGGGGGGG